MMVRRLASPALLRAEGARIPWSGLFDRHLRQLAQRIMVDPGQLERQKRAIGARPVEIHLRWSCSKWLGVPAAPFTVWLRAARDAPIRVNVGTSSAAGSLRLRWGFVAAIVEVECTVLDPARPAALFATYGRGKLEHTVGAAMARGAAGSRITLRVRCSGATRAILMNARDPVVRCQPLQEIVEDPAWMPLERVGLPVESSWPGTSYDTREQGLITALTDPVTAALQRLERGGPPIGWYPLTELGRIAPKWTPPDSRALLEEIRRDLLPLIAPLYRPGLAAGEQESLRDSPTVEPPQQGSLRSNLKTRAELPPLALLTLPAASDPFLALATGFGTAYGGDQRSGDLPLGRADFMITAEYEEVPDRQGRATVVAFVPLPAEHAGIAAPTALQAQRTGWVSPEWRDAPWRESVRISWSHTEPAAALGRSTGGVLARYEQVGGAASECLLPRRGAGDFRPLLLVPEAPEGSEGHHRTGLVDAAAPIPLGSGGRKVGYAVAVEDVFGIWSTWEDVLHSGTEPAATLPRILTLRLTTSFAGTSSCPATLEIELSVDWAERTPAQLELVTTFYPMASANAAPPLGMEPLAPAPAGGFRRSYTLTFLGDTLHGPAGASIEHLDSAGEAIVAPGPLQGEQGRRYRVRIPVPILDFSATRRWGVQAWLRSRLVVLPAMTKWSPDPDHPALANAASPVPVVPLPPPLPPGVPMGSTLDAEGRSHVRVQWSLPAGADAGKIVVWEVAESAFRQYAGLPPRDPEGTLPGWRLQHLREAYDALPPSRRRGAFRRLLELPGTERDVGIALPRGSSDIHLFAITAVSSTGLESAWPDGMIPHEHLQAAMAPRIRRPAPPRVRARLGEAGGVEISLEVPSLIPVREFRLFRTRSPEAARSAETMGPPFAIVPALAPSPALDPDPSTGARSWTAQWTGTFEGSWEEWFIRAVAVPVESVPPEAVRGALSPPSDRVTISVLPEEPPDLGPLSAEVWGPAHEGVLVHASTTIRMRASLLGTHRFSARAGSLELPPIEADRVPAGPSQPSDPPPPGTDDGPVLIQDARAGGHTPLSLWFRRPVATEPVEVVLRVVDPLGRMTERRSTVPGWTPATLPPPSLRLVDLFSIVGRGVVIQLQSDAPIDARPPYSLEITATPRVAAPVAPTPAPHPVPGPIPIPRPIPRPIPTPGPVLIPKPGPVQNPSPPPTPKLPLPRRIPGPVVIPEKLPIPILVRPKPIVASFTLDAIPYRTAPFAATEIIQVARMNEHAPFEYQLFVRQPKPFTLGIAMISPEGARSELQREVD